MNPDDPRHGTHAGAVQHWKGGETPCPPCATEASRARKRNHLNATRGNPGRAPLGTHLWNLIHTAPRNQLAAATGIPHERLRRYDLAGPNQTITRSTRQRLLTADITWTPIGIQRRLQALSALGYSMLVIAEHTDCHHDPLKRLRARAVPKFVRMTIAAKIIATYDRLYMTPAPPSHSSAETRAHATSRGYPPPMAWDNIDDPTEKPKGMKPARKAEKHEAIASELEHLAFMGDTIETACARLHVERKTLLRWCERRGHMDLYMRLVGEAGVA